MVPAKLECNKVSFQFNRHVMYVEERAVLLRIIVMSAGELE
jgi:hypothetical protein